MSLKRRNWLAWLLILVSAVCWTTGQGMMYPSGEGDYTEATVTQATEATMAGSDETIPSTVVTQPTEPENPPVHSEPSRRMPGFLLSMAGLILIFVNIFVFYQQDPVFGPDLLAVVIALWNWYYEVHLRWAGWNNLDQFTEILVLFSAGIVLRELWGWIRIRFSLEWCLVQRLVQKCTKEVYALMFYVISFALVFGFLALGTTVISSVPVWLPLTVSAMLIGGCVWRYGADLDHFKAQLKNYRNGAPIIIGDGAFAQIEAQLLDVQAQHEEAVRTAITSERFKVELISNVSHDLRTPLTSILGYSELLQNEALSPDGQEQLRRLHQKAGYMNDLVESLFELTKVSSGVVESKKEQIDLVRLLEQTIGLFDDQLVDTGLSVRRSYSSESVPVITDGARMHQVFANLLGNAIKYALAGTRIYLEVRETDESFLIRMMNTASYEMDFNPDEIMQRFARGDKARSTKGSGLGLAIAQTYTESVGGSFRVSVDGDQFSAIVELPKN